MKTDRYHPTNQAPTRRLWTAVFLAYLAFGGTLQLLPLTLASRLQSDAAFVGLAVGIAFAATALCRPFAGWIADAGAGKTIVAVGGLLTLTGVVSQAFAGTGWQVLVARLVMGAGEAAVFSGALAWVLQAVPAERRSSTSGLFGLSMWSGLALGPVLAVVAGRGGESIAWFTLTAVSLVAVVIALVLPASALRGRRPAQTPVFWQRGQGAPSALFGMAAYGYGTISAILVLHLENGPGGAAWGLPVFACAFLLMRVAASRAVDRVGGHLIAVGTLAIEALGFVLLVTAGSAPAALIGVAFVGAGCSLAFPAAVGIMLARSPEGTSGAAVGRVTSFWDLGVLAAGVCAGVVATELSYRAAFAAALGVTLLALAVSLTLAARSTGHRPGGRRRGLRPTPPRSAAGRRETSAPGE